MKQKSEIVPIALRSPDDTRARHPACAMASVCIDRRGAPMRTDDIRAIRANARKIVQEAAKIKDQDMRREIGLGAVVIVNLCNGATPHSASRTLCVNTSRARGSSCHGMRQSPLLES